MKLWIDGQSLQTASRQRGIGRYVRELIRAISEGGFGFDVSISFNAGMADEAIAARDYIRQWIHPDNIHVWQGIAEAGEADIGYTERRRLSEIAIAHHITCLQPDIALSASPFEGAGDVAVPLSPGSIPNIFTTSIFYDAIPHRYANEYLTSPLRKSCYYRRLAFYKTFDLNLCISEYSKSEVIDLSGNACSVNISAGVSSDFIGVARRGYLSTSVFPRPKTVLNVGSLDWRKNVETLVEAFAELPDFLKQEVKLILVGDYLPAQLDRIRARWDEHNLPSANFTSLGQVSERELVSLYQSAGLVVQPSLLEGFGLTALEAMSCGTPVIGSATGAPPEILEDPNLLFDPTKPHQIADRIARIFLDPDLTALNVSKGLERARRFSWKNTAELATKAMLQAKRDHRRMTVFIDRGSARQQSLETLGEIAVPPDLMAGTMARAEPEPVTCKRLLVDATSTVRIDHGTGIQRVTKEIVRNLVLKNSQSEFAVIYCDNNEGCFKVSTDPEGLSFKRTPEKVRLLGRDTILMLDSSWEFHREHLPILLSARQRGADVISCLYDLVPIRLEAMCHPGLPPVFVAWFESALTYSTGFVCISKAVADELYAMLEAICFPRPLKIGFWCLGADFCASTLLPSKPAAGHQKRHSFLMVGTIEPRKGHRVAIEAFEILWKEGFDIDLIVVGKPGWESDQLINRLRLHPTAGTRLRWYANIKDDELQGFYAECDALVAASFVEGFGLPLVEAMHFGKPVIASDIPVFHEVTKGGSFAHFFEVGSSIALAAAIRKFIIASVGGDETLAENLPWASWSTSATELQNLLVNDDWYRIYQPLSFKPHTSIFDHGATLMKGPLDIEGRRHRLELIEGPINCGQKLKYILRVTNLSDQVWSSRSVKDSAWAVFLSYRLLNADGGDIISEPPRFGIPFVMIPGDCHYMAVEIPRSAREDSTILAIEMFQENVCWWGTPLLLRLNLRDQASV
jgi:glycosyltransferase involved in cell wall biosynthesis